MPDEKQDREIVKKAFFDHLRGQGFTEAHISAYEEYFDFFLSKLGEARIMDLDPEVLYRQALLAVPELDGEDVVEAFLALMEFFMEFWTERWEAMHPEQ